ncbi:PTS system fructose-specific EIIABC component [Rosistilla ulvae]|uniref:PTS system fructose-specific EIIABC component n=1 Tax=Rosistilla ulvae TaxID=1930277 RepID=A0A517M5D1_9BACT|nr:PTS sugar transporter subunit IIA [Rosistilla ulvae]QDS90068.1 PTS system fructose-specific EIIABC component [Rosistilla ulvae]
MSEENFDVAGLAAYLHLTPDQVNKMAQRGRLPGRRVSGGWIFSEAEVHHWLEQQIGASDLEQLDKVDAVLSRADNIDNDIAIASFCSLDVIEVPLQARTKGSVIRSMSALAARGGMLWDPAAMAEAVKAREELHPTALDCGVALLHPRRPQTSILADSVVALGRTSQPLPFSDTGQLTDVFFLLASYDDRVHLRILSRISRMLTDEIFLGQLREAPDAASARQAILDVEERIDEV